MNVNKLNLNICFQELETVTNQCEQLQTEKEDTSKKLHKVESGYRKMEKEKNELIQVIRPRVGET